MLSIHAMKERLLIQDTTVNKITYYHLLIFVMSLPFDRFYSELALVSLFIHTLIHLRRRERKPVSITTFLIPTSIYLLTIIGTVYTKYDDEAFYEWERQLAMLLFPLIFIFNSFDFKKYKLQVLFGLSISCAITLLCLYIRAFMLIYDNNLPVSSIFNNAFVNHNFSAPIDMHATYFSMYIALAAVTMIYCWANAANRKQRVLFAVMFFILLAGLLQLSSRAVLIAFAIIGNIIVPVTFFKKKRRLVFMIISGLFSLSVFYGLTRIDNFKTRFIADLKEDLTQAGINNNLLEPRAMRWECGWELVKQSPVYGHGSGSEIALLKEVYYERKLYNSYLNELNVHNQYLSMLIKMGIPGLLIFLLMLLSGFGMAFKTKDILFGSFLIIISIVSFSENILDANKGIFFFAFFFGLFYIDNKKKMERATQI